MRKLFIGHTRFSVHQYNSGSFKATRKGDGRRFSEEEYTEWLYDDERLGPRAEIFVEESLPQLAASAEDANLVHIVHYSASLPQKYQDILRGAAEEFPFLHLNEAPGIVAPSAPNKKVLNSVLRNRLPKDGVFGIYRLDDDDVLPINFFERMSPYIVDEHVGWRVSFPESLTAIRTRSEYILPWRRYFPKAAAGLVSIHQKTSDGAILGLQTRAPAKGHMKLDTAYPTVLDSREPGFFQARHKSQDSILGDGASPFFGSMIPTAIEKESVPTELFEEYFPYVSRRIRRNIAEASTELELETVQSRLSDTSVAIAINSCSSQLLLAELGDINGVPPRVEVEVQIDRDPSVSDVQLEKYLRAAGLNRKSNDAYAGSLSFSPNDVYGLFVLETPPGCSVSILTLTADDRLSLNSIRTYPLD